LPATATGTAVYCCCSTLPLPSAAALSPMDYLPGGSYLPREHVLTY
jgi:hypothetical protein